MSVVDKLEARKTNTYYTFDQWLGFLDGAAFLLGWTHRLVKDTGADCWEYYYERGYTPMEAIQEDLSYL